MGEQNEQALHGYAAIQAAYANIAAAAKAGAPLAAAWQRYQDCVTREPQPYHMRWTMRYLERAAAGRPKDQVAILEHGCGAGGTLLYILAHGYTGIHGVDVGGPCEMWNRLLTEIFGITEKRFSVYDGHTLPFPNEKFDFIFSEEVLEHVEHKVFSAYYDEGHRVLSKGGYAYYQVPHRLVPYESHLKAWLIHWLPHDLATATYKVFGFDYSFFRDHLFLRSPYRHFREIGARYNSWQDVTVDRLHEKVDFSYYDGPRQFRRLLAYIFSLPLVGKFAARIAARFMMVQTIAQKL